MYNTKHPIHIRAVQYTMKIYDIQEKITLCNTKHTTYIKTVQNTKQNIQ